MSWLAQDAVRTTGINWESVSAIAAVIAVLMSTVLWMFNRRDKVREQSIDRRERQQAQANTELKQEFTEAINHLAEVLTAKLETKETVAQISVRLARLEGAAGASIPVETRHT